MSHLNGAGITDAMSRRDKVLAASVRRIGRVDNPNVLFLPGNGGDELGSWGVLVFFPRAGAGEKEPSPFAGGAYLYTMTAPPEFPAVPPKFVAQTPNGVYTPNASLCISIGMYHPDSWRDQKANLLPGFAVSGILNGMVCHADMGGGIGLLKTTAREKRELAAKSIGFNRKRHGAVWGLFIAAARRDVDRYAAARPFLELIGASQPAAPGAMSAGAPAESPEEITFRVLVRIGRSLA